MMRKDALRSGSVFVRRHEELQGKSVRELKQLVRQRPGLTKEIMFYGTKLRGTRQFWGARLSELLDMIEQVDQLPTLFLTLSAADLHWPDLFRLALSQRERGQDQGVEANLDQLEQALQQLTEEQRRSVIADNPIALTKKSSRCKSNTLTVIGFNSGYKDKRKSSYS